MPTRASWSNPDGLVVYFGKRYTENGIAASVEPANGLKSVIIHIRGEDIPASVADTELLAADPRSVTIPAGAVIKSATLLVTETFTGSSSTLDIGLTNASTGLVSDMNGIDAAVALSALDANDLVKCDGALVFPTAAAALTAAQKVVFGYGTAAFTAGNAKLTVEYFEPPVQSA